MLWPRVPLNAVHHRKEGAVFIAKLIRLLNAWWRYQENVRELSSLGDRELADIGISRSEIPAVAWTSATH
jgi:uncharacterized protein YjiS (DUF1127 family)